MEYGSLALFYDITDQEVEAMIQCFRMRRCRFHPGQIICTYGESAGEVGVLVSGEAELVRLDYAGNRTILERLETGGVFGESLAFTPTLGDCVEVVSAAGSEVLFMEYSHIMKRCENACAHHSKLVQNMFRLVEVLSRRSIRDKLMCWFQLRRLAAGADSFTLPFTLSALADYISADRSAMMRELKRMKEEGLVEMDGRRVTLRTGEG